MNGKKRTHGRSPKKYLWFVKNPSLFVSWQNKLQFQEVQTLISQDSPQVSWFRCILRFVNAESIHVFTNNVLAICSATSLLFGYPSRSKLTPLDTQIFLVATLRNQDKKFAFVRVDEDGALSRSSGFMKTCHNMNIIFQNIGVYAYSINGKSESPNKTLANITRSLLLN